jgi:hypothetical protein
MGSITHLVALVLVTGGLTPVFWGMGLVGLRKVRSSGLLGTGLPNELLDELERYLWAPGIVVALCVAAAILYALGA